MYDRSYFSNSGEHANRVSARHGGRQRAATRSRPVQASRQQESLSGSHDRLSELEYASQAERQIEWADTYDGNSPECDSDVQALLNALFAVPAASAFRCVFLSLFSVMMSA